MALQPPTMLQLWVCPHSAVNDASPATAGWASALRTRKLRNFARTWPRVPQTSTRRSRRLMGEAVVQPTIWRIARRELPSDHPNAEPEKARRCRAAETASTLVTIRKSRRGPQAALPPTGAKRRSQVMPMLVLMLMLMLARNADDGTGAAAVACPNQCRTKAPK